MVTKFESIAASTAGDSAASKITQSSDGAEFVGAHTPATESADWSEHEHVSAQVQLEAEKLVDLVGTPELAKQAINIVERQQQRLSTGDSELSASLAKSRQASAKIAATFLKSLTDLETSLATPVVSGELTEWVTNALRDCERVKAILLRDVQNIHADLYSIILRENVDLSAQVEKLRAADAQIAHSDCDEVISSLNQIKRQARLARQDEAKLSGALANVIDLAMEFVIAARGQETAISAWLSEAFNRDLGSGD